jgi:protein-disulfide isomerase
MRNILIVAGGVAAVAAIAIGVYFGTRPNTPPGGGPTVVAQVPGKQQLLEALPGDHILGDPKAGVTIIEYASLTCSHCAQFHVAVLPELKKKWIDTGKVRLIYRDFPLDQVAAKAAQIAECAGKDRYFGVLDILFRGQMQWAVAQDPVAELAKPLRIAGLGDTEIKACLANQAVADAVVADLKGGETLGVNSTPTLFIGGTQYRGSRSIDDIDGVLAKLVK